jgi:excinuclease UvrABC ATPase subunit
MEANFSYGYPEEIVKIKESVTGKYLKEKLQLI